MSMPILVISVIAAGIVSALVAWFFSALKLGVPTTPRRIAVGATALIVFAAVAAGPEIWAKTFGGAPLAEPSVVGGGDSPNGSPLSRPPDPGYGASQGEALKVLLLPFDNKSGKPLPDLGAKAKEVLESFIVGLGGIQVVSREQLPQLQEESKLRAFYGDGDGTIDLVLVGADFVLSGVVLSYEVDRQEVEAYGLKNVKDHYRMGLTLRLVDARSGVVRFSKGFQAKHSARYAQGAVPSQPVARTLELLNDVLEQGADGLRQGLLGERTAAGG